MTQETIPYVHLIERQIVTPFDMLQSAVIARDIERGSTPVLKGDELARWPALRTRCDARAKALQAGELSLKAIVIAEGVGQVHFAIPE